MPPFHFWPVLWLTLPLLCVTSDAAARAPSKISRWSPWRRWPIGRAGEIGWWFGFGYHLAGLFWIGEAFLVEAEVFAWLLPFAVTLLPAGLAFFTALAAASTQLNRRMDAVDRAAVLALGFGITEWLRGHVLTGFPWNVLGYALTSPLPLMQSACIFGIYGLTVIAVLVFAVPFALFRQAPGRWRAACLMALLPLVVMYAGGVYRLGPTSGVVAGEGQPRAKLRLVQLSIPQRERMQPENLRRIFDQHLAMSLTAPDGRVDNAAGIDVIVWPEAAMPFLPLAQPAALEGIGAMLPAGAQLVSGALRLETDTTGARKIFNSLLVFESTGGGPARLAGTYDKLHLVPFGEYLPAQPLLEALGLQQITRQRGGFAPGAGAYLPLHILKLGAVLPLICYEVIFPKSPLARHATPDLILTITNDGWFGNSTGPRQHYHQARVRAVELGVPMIRASSNGISALIDGYGRETGRLELNAVGTLDIVPPARLQPPLYARFGDMILLVLMGFVSVWIASRRNLRCKTQHNVIE